jgi:hypothetical protein
MVNVLGFNVGVTRCNFCEKCPKIDLLPVNLDFCAPFFAFWSFVDSKKFILSLWATQVLHVYRSSNVSEITDSVVVLDPVNVINEHFGEIAMNKHPCKAVGCVFDIVNPDSDVALSIFCASNLPDFAPSRRGFPSKQPSFWAIRENFLETTKIKIAHAVAPFKQWFEKWRLSVGSTGPLRHYRSP